jgi:uncharacterized protein (TIGR03790 family)
MKISRQLPGSSKVSIWLLNAIVLCLLVSPRFSLGSPGPDTLVVVANGESAGSVLLAERYANARDIHQTRICVVNTDPAPQIALEDLERDVLMPLRACIDHLGGFDLLEAVVLVRGMPLNVIIPTEAGSMVVSLSALLGVLPARDLAGQPFIGQDPGYHTLCGGMPCLTARWLNPYTGGAFRAGWTRERHDGRWQMVLVTALDGYTDEDAFGLVASGLLAERDGPSGEFILMDGGDAARSVRDFELDTIAAQLGALGVDARRLAFDSELTDRDIGAFVTGTVNLGQTIEGNRYQPGSIVDNLTSFGAVPANFMAGGEVQTSVARWVAEGVAGVHGTTAEPLSNAFPSRRFLTDYVSGYSLAESYFKNLPYVYWRNLVLGDPITAPYAVRPVLELLADQQTSPGFVRLELSLRDPLGRLIGPAGLTIDGVYRQDLSFGGGELCFRGSDTVMTTVLVAARIEPEPKTVGWTRLELAMENTPSACPVRTVMEPADSAQREVIDRGIVDASDQGVDFGEPEFDSFVKLVDDTQISTGCSAVVSRALDTQTCLVLGLLLVYFYRIKRMRSPG